MHTYAHAVEAVYGMAATSWAMMACLLACAMNMSNMVYVMFSSSLHLPETCFALVMVRWRLLQPACEGCLRMLRCR